MAAVPSGDTPARVGRYEILCHLATGGMARIFLARAAGIGSFERYVVLKTISPERANDHRFVTMFLDEARLAATLNHQNIAQVYEVDEADGALFITMEYVHGENLRQILETTLRKGWTIPTELAVMIVSAAAAGLHHAHERKGKNAQPLNIVHRDVSPANIMVGYDGSVKLLDFGIAKAEERSTKTQQGTIKGKYGYMSPEQCRGKPIDRRSDIFALGIVLYEITTLRRAFRGNDDFDTMKRIVNGDLIPPSVAVPGYPRELEAIVLTAMARDPEFRFQTAQEMLEALDAFMVRAKLAGSASTMGRFMTQLFGSRREPWVELDRGGKYGGDHPTIPSDQTEISPQADSDSNAEATAVLDDRAMDDSPTLRGDDGDLADSVTTSPTRSLGDSMSSSEVAAMVEQATWVPPRAPARPSESDAHDVEAWSSTESAAPTRRGPGVPDSERPSAQRIPISNAPIAPAGMATYAPPAPMIPGAAAAMRTDVPSTDVLEPVPSLRPSRTAMWIVIVLVIVVIGVVAGTIAMGLMNDPAASAPK